MMKRLFLLGLFVGGLHAATFAQDTIYLNREAWCPKAKAQAYAVVTQEDGLTKVNTYTLAGVLKESTRYSKYKENVTQRIKEGESITYYADGQTEAQKKYRKNRLESVTVFYPDGKLQREDTYRKGKLKKSYLYNEAGEKARNKEVYEQTPQFPGGNKAFINLLHSKIVYPKDALQRKVQGRVVAQFVINQEGKMERFRIAHSLMPSMDKAVLEALQQINQQYTWKPGIEKGQKTATLYTIAPVFRLQ